ncbi:hypothetical protein L6Q85_15585 [bacterium]|nr:hypothetical protein [bacterium]NUP92169.1 hypothetical protein [Candidatus Omnitrophota bacterium]
MDQQSRVSWMWDQSLHVREVGRAVRDQVRPRAAAKDETSSIPTNAQWHSSEQGFVRKVLGHRKEAFPFPGKSDLASDVELVAIAGQHLSFVAIEADAVEVEPGPQGGDHLGANREMGPESVHVERCERLVSWNLRRGKGGVGCELVAGMQAFVPPFRFGGKAFRGGESDGSFVAARGG